MTDTAVGTPSLPSSQIETPRVKTPRNEDDPVASEAGLGRQLCEKVRLTGELPTSLAPASAGSDPTVVPGPIDFSKFSWSVARNGHVLRVADPADSAEV